MSRGMHNLTNGTELSPRGMRNTAEYDNFLLFDQRNRAYWDRAVEVIGPCIFQPFRMLAYGGSGGSRIIQGY
jgi:hypothetical protein